MSDPSTATSLHGTPVVPGVAYGPALVVRGEISPEAVARFDGASLDEDAALTAYDDAAAAVADGFTRRADKASDAAAEVLTASAGLARDKGLRSAVRKHLRSGEDLLTSVAAAVEQFAAVFTQMGGLMAERVTDLRDIERRVVAHLVGEPEPGVQMPDAPAILVAEDLAPSDTATLDPAVVLALVTERGGPTSHTAIISRQLGIPCVVGAAGVMEIEAGTLLLVDGDDGHDRHRARRPTRPHAWSRRTPRSGPRWPPGAARARRPTAPRSRSWPMSPTASPRAPRRRDRSRASGCSAPSSASSTASTSPPRRSRPPSTPRCSTPFAGRYVVVRTLDAGSDKPVAFATHEGEENPALGVRGLRLSFDNPGLLSRQLDGIARRGPRDRDRDLGDGPDGGHRGRGRRLRRRRCARAGLKPGVMVEVPSAALLAHRMLEVVDFLSIGTNDLTQYTMAADRMATDLAHLTDAWQPAVLQLIAITAEAGKQAGKPVGVCGEAAADPLLACVLVGMGITSLSMASAAVRPVGARIAAANMDTLEDAAEAALSASDPTSARDAVRRVLGG